MNNPEIPEVFGQVVGLGMGRGYHPATRWNRWGNLVISLLLVGAAGVVLLMGIYNTYVVVQKHGPAMIDDKLPGPLIIAVIMFALGMLAGWGAFNNWRMGVMLYERGFAYNDR